MSCCGNKRSLYGSVQARLADGAMLAAQAPIPALLRPSPAPGVVFEYTGETGLSMIGSVTRSLYRFEGRHSRVTVDARDAPAVNGIPRLRRLG